MRFMQDPDFDRVWLGIPKPSSSDEDISQMDSIAAEEAESSPHQHDIMIEDPHSPPRIERHEERCVATTSRTYHAS